jgi:phosphatidylserine/phosphatidylglycerophosphate/cardiolipin synthase-like enzyme
MSGRPRAANRRTDRPIASDPATAEPSDWFLPFSAIGEGRPWADGTEMAARADRGEDPWDSGCRVTPLLGGFEAMSAMRDRLERAIAVARRSAHPPGHRGHVYLIGWRFNPLRDLSVENPWGTGPWRRPAPGDRVADQSAIGLVLRLMQAGVRVRMLLWYPFLMGDVIGLRAHIEDHAYTAHLVQAESRRLHEEVWKIPGDPPIGLVCHDLRMPSRAACHHNKLLVVRVGDPRDDRSVHAGFCGGMDLAFTRRDAPDASHPYSPDRPQFLGGDWQSGDPPGNGFGIPAARDMDPDCWPHQQGVENEVVDYSILERVRRPILRQSSDIPEGAPDPRRAFYGPSPQVWHDQHLLLEGPIVATLEAHVRERWTDGAARLGEIGTWKDSDLSTDEALFTEASAFDADARTVRPLPPVAPAESCGDSRVQLWRTVPLRNRTSSPFRRGEFTLQAGIARACARAKHLVFIVDQYFWSLPLARLLNARLIAEPGLRVLVLLPPWSEKGNGFTGAREHRARALALNALVAPGRSGPPVADRVGVYNLWHPVQRRGIYCHAKMQLYDDALLVCGSGNLNRRSFTLDTELDCAVLDRSLVLHHRRRLWSIFFPDTPVERAAPSLPVDLSVGRDSARFFDAFRNAAARPDSFLVPDPWRDSAPRLPNGVRRRQRVRIGYRRSYDHLIDPTSIAREVERGRCPHENPSHDVGPPGRLDQVVALVETCRGPASDGRIEWPYRRGE